MVTKFAFAIKKICEEHLSHHLSVKDDMSLTEDNGVKGLTFTIKRILPLALILFIIISSLIYVLKIDISIYTNLTICILSVISFIIIWNTIHTKMHHKTVNLPLTPYINNEYIPDALYNPFLKNHDLHHQVKGKNKGNFNVVVLGADELFNTRNTIK